MKSEIEDLSGLAFFYLVSLFASLGYWETKGEVVTIKPVIFLWVIALASSAGVFAKNRLKSEHREVYEELGSPRFVSSLFNPKSWSFLRYLITLEYLNLKDAKISAGFSLSIVLTIVGVSLLWI